jgi:hypothetical protein
MLDSDSGKVIADLPAVGIVDDMGYDAKLKRLYLAGDQFLDVFEQKDPDHYALLARIQEALAPRRAFWFPDTAMSNAWRAGFA